MVQQNADGSGGLGEEDIVLPHEMLRLEYVAVESYRVAVLFNDKFTDRELALDPSATICYTFFQTTLAN